MKKGAFEIEIPQGKTDGLPEGYCNLAHETVYTLLLTNTAPFTRCSADVCIDGKSAGCFIIPAAKTIELKRPITSTGQFTFFQQGTAEATESRYR